MISGNFRRTMNGSLCIGAIALSLGIHSASVVADGNEILGTPSIPIAQGTGFVSEGVSVENGPGVVEFNVPDGATINQVLLYWGERRTVEVGENAHLMKVFDTVVEGQLIGDARPANNFRADVTDLGFVVPGNNEILVESLQTDGSVQGAAFIVIFDAPVGHDSANYGGHAVGTRTTIGQQTVSVVEAGPLPPSGGLSEPAPINATDIEGLGSATTVSARTVGTGGQTRSTAAVEDLGIGIAGIGVNADAINSEATATCTTAGPQVSGTSTFADLSVGSLLHLPIMFPPNTVLLNIPRVIRVVANQQSQSGSGNSRAIEVTGLRITSPRTLFIPSRDVQIARSYASIDCDPAIVRNEIQIRDGADFDFIGNTGSKTGTTELQTFHFEAATHDRTYSPAVFVTDGSVVRPDVTEFYLDNVLQMTLNEVLDESDGAETDADTYGPIPVPAGATSVGFRPTSAYSPGNTLLPDSLNWVFGVFQFDAPQVSPRLYEGRATVIRAALAGLSTVAVADTGELPSQGGDLSDDVADLVVPQVAGSVTGSASTVGAGDETQSEASVESLNVSLLGNTISADLIQTSASAVCAGGAANTSGNTLIANLVVNGTAIDTSLIGEISVPGGTLFIDEKVVTGGGNSETIQVNALRLYVANPLIDEAPLANVVISASKAGITCN